MWGEILKWVVSVFITADSANEDVLWTEKYQPQNSNELIGNTAAIKKLHRLEMIELIFLKMIVAKAEFFPGLYNDV